MYNKSFAIAIVNSNRVVLMLMNRYVMYGVDRFGGGAINIMSLLPTVANGPIMARYLSWLCLSIGQLRTIFRNYFAMHIFGSIDVSL